jgi:hypothetical protein
MKQIQQVSSFYFFYHIEAWTQAFTLNHSSSPLFFFFFLWWMFSR